MNPATKKISVPREFLPIHNHLVWLGILGFVLFAVRAFLVVKAGAIPPLSVFGSPPTPFSATYAPWIIVAGLLAWQAAATLGGAKPADIAAVPRCGGEIVPFRILQILGAIGLVSAFLLSDPRRAIEPEISLVQSLFVFFLPKLFQSYLLITAGTAGVALLRLRKRNEALLPAGPLRSARQTGWSAVILAAFTGLASASVIQGILRVGMRPAQIVVSVASVLFQFAVFVFLAVLCFRFRLAPEAPPAREAGPVPGASAPGPVPAP